MPKVIEDQWVLMGLPVNLANLDLKVLLVVTEALDLRASWVHLVLVVLPVNLAKQVHLVLLVLLDLLDLLVNRWATTLLLWLQFLDKVNPRYADKSSSISIIIQSIKLSFDCNDRVLTRWLVMTRLVSLPN